MQSPYCEDSFVAREGLTASLRARIDAGFFFVQDLSSSLAVAAAAPKRGERVLDPRRR